jgi:hypothetical protein
VIVCPRVSNLYQDQRNRPAGIRATGFLPWPHREIDCLTSESKLGETIQ